MLSLSVIGVFVATLGIYWWLTRENRQKGFKSIPGPFGLPVLGNVLQVGSTMHIQFSRWAQTYGDIFKIRLGNRSAIVVSDPKMIKEMFSDNAFTGRQIFEGLEMFENEQLGIASAEGEMWEVHRRFLLRQLRDFGFGKSTMEELVMEEVKETVERLSGMVDKPVDNMKDVLLIAIINSLWRIVGDKRFEHDDPKILNMVSESNEFMQKIMKRAIVLFLPWTRHLLPKIEGLDEARRKGIQFYADIVNDHKKTFQDGAPRDFIDVYLEEMKAQANNPASMFYGDRAERQLQAVLADLFFAGTDTTSTTLTWTVLYLSKYPSIQKKLQDEIKSVTGNTRYVSLSDRPRMPYTLALMDEVLRLTSILPNGVQHRATVDKEFRGYLIPQDTWIFANLYHMHRDPKLWNEPEKFMPERHLSADGQVYQKSDKLMPFQIGRRQCVGESTARDSYFLFLTNIFQRFSISLNPNAPEPSFDPDVGLLLSPKPYSVLLESRRS